MSIETGGWPGLGPHEWLDPGAENDEDRVIAITDGATGLCLGCDLYCDTESGGYNCDCCDRAEAGDSHA